MVFHEPIELRLQVVGNVIHFTFEIDSILAMMPWLRDAWTIYKLPSLDVDISEELITLGDRDEVEKYWTCSKYD